MLRLNPTVVTQLALLTTNNFSAQLWLMASQTELNGKVIRNMTVCNITQC